MKGAPPGVMAQDKLCALATSQRNVTSYREVARSLVSIGEISRKELLGVKC